MLPKLLQKLLSVNMLRKGVLRLLGSSVAALKVSNLDRDKNISLAKCLKKKIDVEYCILYVLSLFWQLDNTFSERMERLKCGSYM